MTGYILFTIALLSVWTPLAVFTVDETEADRLSKLSPMARFVLVFMLPLLLTIWLMERIDGLGDDEGKLILKQWWAAVWEGRNLGD